MGQEPVTRREAEVWAAVCAGDTTAFGAIFAAHSDAVYTHCARRLGDASDADDLVAQVFLQAWRSAGRARLVNGSLRPWLLVVANNMASHHLRAAGRRERLEQRAATSAVVEDVADQVVQAAELQRRAAVVAAAIARLKPHEQDVVGLVDLAELSYADAAAALNVPIGTVRSRLSRAHTKLRTLLLEAGIRADVVDLEEIS